MIDILCKDIVRGLGVNCFVETGTDKGETVAAVSRWFSEDCPDFGHIAEVRTDGSRSYHSWNEPIAYPVFAESRPCPYQIHSVDVDRTSYRRADANFSHNPNIHVYHDSSQEFLRRFLGHPQADTRYLFFLDAHWGKYWPLRDEIRVIVRLPRFLIVVDDFFVPGKSDPAFPHGEFGFDIYRRRILHWGYIRDLFKDRRVRIFYPQAPNRDKRGWVLITGGYPDEDLVFLDQLPLFEMGPDDERHTGAVKPGWRTHLDGRNLLKGIVPISALRALHRIYERLTYKPPERT